MQRLCRLSSRPLHNTRLLERLRALETFDAEDQEAVLKLIDAMIVKHRVAGALEVGRARKKRSA